MCILCDFFGEWVFVCGGVFFFFFPLNFSVNSPSSEDFLDSGCQQTLTFTEWSSE